MMDTVMTRPRRFTLESGKRSSELLGLAQLHVAASLLAPALAVSAGHQQAAEAAGPAAEARQLHCTHVQCAWLHVL